MNHTTTRGLPAAVAAVLVGLLLVAGCTSPESADGTRTGPPPADLTVYAAASLTDAFTELGEAFEAANPGVTVTFDFDGSQVLRTQLEQGAAADVFAPASTKQMDLAKVGGLMRNDSVKVFATNRLAVLVPKANPAGIASFGDLADSNVRLAVGAKDVPIGDYARRVLDTTVTTASYGPDFRVKVLGNVVSEETSVNALATRVVLGEVDAGIGYASDVPVAQRERVLTVEVPPELNVVAEYSIGVLARSDRSEIAQAFSELARSPEGRAVLERHGFGPA
ncbi:MAG TPA: molybdate ABC transporter substrate-binding protein [Methanoregulaceae archaeon]|nr:molybdate ABC transporter substrate-binding protein [Methanoregulaceae archaeon]